MGNIGIAAFGNAKGFPLLGVIVVIITVIAISSLVGYRLGKGARKQDLRLS
jgi:hypothetical protein